jgi:hypothetical protein
MKLLDFFMVRAYVLFFHPTSLFWMGYHVLYFLFLDSTSLHLRMFVVGFLDQQGFIGPKIDKFYMLRNQTFNAF